MDTDQSGYLPQNPSLSQPSHVSDVANKTAKTAVPIHPHLANRWTPRGFDRIHNVSDDELRALLEDGADVMKRVRADDGDSTDRFELSRPAGRHDDSFQTGLSCRKNGRQHPA